MTTFQTRDSSEDVLKEESLKKTALKETAPPKQTVTAQPSEPSAVPSAAPTGPSLKPTVQTGRRLRRCLTRHPKLIQAAGVLAITSGTAFALLYLLFRGAWATYPDNNLAVLRSIFVMEASRNSTRIIQEDDSQVVTRSYASLDPYLEEEGWRWVNRFGSTVTYGREDDLLIASCSPYSPVYIVCNLSELP